jgi:hypothetical protein
LGAEGVRIVCSWVTGAPRGEEWRAFAVLWDKAMKRCNFTLAQALTAQFTCTREEILAVQTLLRDIEHLTGAIKKCKTRPVKTNRIFIFEHKINNKISQKLAKEIL